jgi:hypothetical protein
MAYYRILIADLLTNNIVAELPLTQVAFSQQLNSAGTFSGNILISDVDSSALNIVNSTQPAKNAIYVDRDGVLVWGGIIWNRTYSSDSQHLTLTAREFESYFERRRVTGTSVFQNVDQFTVAQQLIKDAQAASNGNIGVVVGTDVSGVPVTKIYYSYELRTVLSAIQDLAKSDVGFDFAISVAYDANGNPYKFLNMGYPRLGTAYDSANLNAPVFEFPAGNVISYEYPEDGSSAANTIYAVGAGSNEGKTIAVATDTTKLDAGWPLLEESSNYTDIADGTLLGNLAAGQLKAVSEPPVTMKIVAAPYIDPVLGDYQIGDDVRVRILDDRFPNGIDTVYRIMALTLQAGENGPERVTLTLTLPQV